MYLDRVRDTFKIYRLTFFPYEINFLVKCNFFYKKKTNKNESEYHTTHIYYYYKADFY